MEINKSIIQKFDTPGPRYTSYPTAPEWNSDFSQTDYIEKLHLLGESEKSLSVYIHIPFCEQLCYFCACNMMIRPKENKYGDEYVQYVTREMNIVFAALGKRMSVKQLHLGGGTPTFLSEDQLIKLMDAINRYFDIDVTSEVAIELDPRTITRSKLELLKKLGFNRVSMGVQDFDSNVQHSINRVQPIDLIKEVYGWCRELQFDSVNFDLIYGLPYQTIESFDQTADSICLMKPDRIALYSFAYLPWMRKHQNKVEEDKMPSNDEKVDIFLNARTKFLQSGYKGIAMDHFALTDDEMAIAFDEKRLYRNFMGYTVKPADEYIGFGVSSIGFLENTFAQNIKILKDYYETLDDGRLPIERGKILSSDDIIRQTVIKEFMCHFHVDKSRIEHQFAIDFDRYFDQEQEHISQCIEHKLLELSGTDLVVTDLGQLFIRNICMGFDWYLRQKNAHTKFSKTV